MAIKYYSSIDLNENELQKAVIHKLGSAPSGPSEGQIYYNSSSGNKSLYVFDGSSWLTVGQNSISTLTVETSIVSGDKLAFSDESETGDINNSITVDNLIGTGLQHVTEAAIANGDYLMFLDGGATGTAKKEALADVATLFAGSGLTATNSVIAVDTLNQDTTGTADHVTITDNESTDEENQITFIEGAAGAGSRGLEADGDFTYNPSSGTVSATVFKGNIDAVDGDFDGTLEADALTIGGTNILTGGIITTLGAIAQDSISFYSSAADDPMLTLENNANDATGARILLLKDKGAAGADGDEIGEIIFAGDNDAQEQTNYAKIRGLIADASDGTEGGKFEVRVATHDGEMQPGLIIQDGDAEDEIDVTLGNTATSIVTTAGHLTVTGNLTVSGTTTTVNTATLTVEDPLIKLASGNTSADSVDIGFYGLYDNSGSQDVYTGLTRDASDDKWHLWKLNQAEPTTVVNHSGTGFAVDTLVANLEGNVTGTATVATSVTASSNTADETVYLTFVDGQTGTQGIETAQYLTYNPDTRMLTSQGLTGTLTGDVTGDLTGNADTADLATAVTVTDSTANTDFPVVFHNESNALLDDTAAFEYNPSSGTLIVANLDIGTDVDVDGTLETDALTIAGTAIVAQATASAVGGVELATAAEVITGTDTARVVTADTLSAKSVVATLAQSSLTDDNIVTVTHNLGTADVIVQLFDMSTEATVFADVYRTAADLSTASTSVISIDFGTAPANDIRCLITSLAGATASGTIAYT